ncbi:protein rolling stone-like [Patiria miniata]|uniref:Protein rolling stone n=1 Tax=Patiria miniata TaxID=46514 RepID=A0A913ZC57_PATMI|nr:protein rolling stone-like [Patiria miniata]
MATTNCCKKAGLYLGFDGEPVQRFTLPQAKWPLAPISWCIFRTFLAVYLFIWLILILVEWGEPADSKAKWLIYVSDWSFLVLILYLTVMAIGNIYYHVRRGCRITPEVDPESGADPEGGIPMSTVISPQEPLSSGGDGGEPLEPLPWYFKLAWFLQTIAFTAGLFVAINFYTLVFSPSRDVLTAYNFHVHGVNLIVIVLDVVLSATPMRLLHLIYPTLYAALYFMFTLIYQKAGGLNELGGVAIYSKFLDWGGAPSTTVIVMVLTVFVATPIMHLVWYAIYRIRHAVSKRRPGYCWSY